jgi:hypothetical protein
VIPSEFIICLLDVLKNDLGDVDEAMFQCVERPCEIIFCITGIEKANWTNSLVVLSGKIALTTHNLPSVRLKNDFGEDDEAMFQGFERPYEFIFCIVGIEKSDLDEVASVLF